MSALRWIGFFAGIVILVLTGASVMATLILPRATAPRLNLIVSATLRRLFLLTTDPIDSYRTRDRIRALAGPAYLIVMLFTWVGLIYISFALMFTPFLGSLGDALAITGSSMFTLGFDAPRGLAPTLLVFFCAMSGLVIVALQVAYLPTLYAAFNRRETLVTMLEFLGGVPAWGPEILIRHELIDNTERLGWLYERWTEWAADVSESHTTYPQLIHFRSPNPYRSWLIGLLAVMDAAALHLSLSPLTAPGAARPLMRMGYVALRELGTAEKVPFDPDPDPADPIRLTRAEFDDAVDRLSRIGWKMDRSPDEAWVHFRGWRVNYEAVAYGLAEQLDAPPALWSGPRRRGRDQVILPARPPHRTPLSDESKTLLKVRAKRRVVRQQEDSTAEAAARDAAAQLEPAPETPGAATAERKP